MSAFWYRVGRGRCSIRIAPAKSTRFLLVLVNSATVVEKFGSFAAESRGFYRFL